MTWLGWSHPKRHRGFLNVKQSLQSVTAPSLQDYIELYLNIEALNFYMCTVYSLATFGSSIIWA